MKEKRKRGRKKNMEKKIPVALFSRIYKGKGKEENLKFFEFMRQSDCCIGSGTWNLKVH